MGDAFDKLAVIWKFFVVLATRLSIFIYVETEKHTSLRTAAHSLSCVTATSAVGN
jgi:hypothetical protein